MLTSVIITIMLVILGITLGIGIAQFVFEKRLSPKFVKVMFMVISATIFMLFFVALLKGIGVS